MNYYETHNSCYHMEEFVLIDYIGLLFTDGFRQGCDTKLNVSSCLFVVVFFF